MSDSYPRSTTTGLSREAAESSVAKFFAGTQWEPPKVDPHFVTASAFFAKLADAHEPAGAGQP